MLRTETSPSQIHTMQRKPPPIYMVSLGRVYRRDEITATRFPIFHQFEGLAVDRNITLADLKGTLLHVMRALFGEERAGSLPYALLPVHRAVDRAGHLLPDLRDGRLPDCKYTGWIEIGGAGMVDPQVFRERRPRPRGVDGLRVRLRASSGRRSCATAISEIRPFWENDLRVLRQF